MTSLFDPTPENLAPDVASLKAARDLADAQKWHHLTQTGEEVRGEVHGSSSEPYRAIVELSGPNFRCSCPSRKVPCKHALALWILHRAQPGLFGQIDSPLVAEAPEELTPAALPDDWATKLGGEFEKPYFQQLRAFLRQERAKNTVYPPHGEVFSAFSATPLEQTQVLILGQDPYHGPGQAHGMAFSVRPGVAPPPSLQNMFLELKNDLGVPISKSGFLMPWAQQGVLLLNAVLTVQRGEPNSHKGQGWEKFTDAAIKTLSEREKPVVFVLWGAYARKKKALLNLERHIIVESAHPSPLSAYNGFFGSKPFSQINAALQAAGDKEMDWDLG